MVRDENIVVELPGASDEQFAQIRSVISRTARLEFKVVDDEATFLRDLTDLPEGIARGQETVSAGEENPNVQSYYLTASGEDARARLQAYIAQLRGNGTVPEGRELLVGEADLGLEAEDLEEGETPEEVWRTYTVHTRADVTGDAIDDAAVANDPQDNNPYVALTFNSAGARAFERLTGANVRRRMAIVLDDRVDTAPVIQSRIGGGHAQITLGRNESYNDMLNEASELVVVLRAGALPAPIRPANEQLIGPSLGADAVEQGLVGAGIGVLLVLVFMAVYYRTGGLIADVAVVLNLLFLVSILAAFEATLTLPGIAGIALTIGMAVDANVLINERIREEMRLGKAPSTAVALGYDRAFTSIFDSQLTTFIAGVVLFQYGTGPIRGFAVTLMIGIITSLFTSVFCTKVIFDWLVRGLRVSKLSVG
jgi:preprotein translocase subunit SecD